MRRNHLFCVVAIVAMANLFAACGGPDTVVQVLPVETHTIYVCGDGSQVTDATLCPPTAPVVETRTEYVCRDGQIMDKAEKCPNWTVTCPPGTEPYMDNARLDDGCTYVATCHEGYAYVPETSTCVKVACPPGQTLSPDGYCTMPEVRHNTCATDSDCSAGERCNTALTCVVPCHRDADCNDPSLWCGAPIIASDATLATCQLAQNGVITISRAATSRKSDIIVAGSQGMTVATYEFAAAGEAFYIDSLTLVNCLGFTIDDPGCSGIGATLGQDETLTRVEIQYQNGSIQMRYVGFLVNGHVLFNNMELFVIVGNAVNRAMPITIVVDTLPMENGNGNVSGTQFQLNVAGFTAVGLSSGTRVFGGTAPANPMTVRITKPTVTLASGTPSGAAYQGFSEILRFNVTADAAGYIGINMLNFRLNTTDNANTGWNKFRGFGSVGLTASDFRMYASSNPAQEIPAGMWLLNASDTAANENEGDVITRVVFYFDPRTIDIAAGTTKTFTLKMNTTGASSSQDDVVRMDITDIEWSDAGMSETINGSLIKHLPVIGGTLIF